MEAVKDVSQLIFIKSRGGKFRWLTISTLMLAVGMLPVSYTHLTLPTTF